MKNTRVNIEILKKGLTNREFFRRLGLREGIAGATTRGWRHNRECQEKIAAFLEIDPVELWGETYWKNFDEGARRAG